MSYFSKCPVFSTTQRGPIKNTKQDLQQEATKESRYSLYYACALRSSLYRKFLRNFSSISEGKFR